jgi:hypothetical protein
MSCLRDISYAIAIAVAVAGPAHATDDLSPVASGMSAALYAKPAASLLPAAAEALRQRVLSQCGLVESNDLLPWYFHFEFGRALLGAGDALRAVEQLSMSIDLNPVPRADKRLYGMWFTDYLPYIQLAEAHARLDNWPCAAHAMRLSQETGEAVSGRIDPMRIRALQEAIERNVDAVGACNVRDVIDPNYMKSAYSG